MNDFKFGVIAWSVAFALVMLLLWPFATIWALNTLFALKIAVTFETWLAVIVLTAAVHTVRKSKNV
jgi:hypothetical protein